LFFMLCLYYTAVIMIRLFPRHRSHII